MGRGSYLGGSTIIGRWSFGWFSKDSKPPKKSKPRVRSPEPIAEAKARSDKKPIHRIAKAQTKHKRKEAHEERRRILMAESARKKAEREADPNYIAMMEERARKKRKIRISEKKMSKAKVRSMQRGAYKRDREPMSREEFYAGTKIILSRQEEAHFSFGRISRDALLESLTGVVRQYARAGYRKPRDVAKLLNNNGYRTACGEKWSPRLAWFLLKFMFERPPKPPKKEQPKLFHRAEKMVNSAARTASPNVIHRDRKPLTKGEIAQRLKALGRIVREPDG